MMDNLEKMALSYDEYMQIHKEWAGTKESIDNLLRRVSLETTYKIIKFLKEEVDKLTVKNPYVDKPSTGCFEKQVFFRGVKDIKEQLKELIRCDL